MMQRPNDGFPARAAIAVLAAAWVMAIGLVGTGAEAPAAPAPGAAAAGPAAPAQGTQAADFVGDDTCAACHEGERDSLRTTLHAKSQDPRTPAATGRTCEACHGPGRAHAESGNRADIRHFGADMGRENSEACVSCHNRGPHTMWAGSAHDARNISCTTCHSVHGAKSANASLKQASEMDNCATCHKQQALKVTRAQHMPLVEGKMTCSSCHNPHGSTNVKQLKVGNWVNESCVSCHAEKRGPFLWEHAAGRESCSTCHDPHGSSNDRMLVARAPMLCQRCHIGTRHPSTIYDNRNVTPGASPSNRIYGRSCVTCHSNIHGSNHPSGNAFLR